MTAIRIFVWPAILLAGLPQATKAELKPQTLQAFDRYVKNAEARIESSRASGAFLWADGTPVRKEHVGKGEVVSEPWTGNGDIEVPDGLIHDWIGAVFIPHTTLARTISLVEDYDNHKNIYKPEVIDSKLIEHNGNDYRIRLRLLKKKVITVVLNTDHEVHYTPIDQTRWFSRSYSTRIAEIESPGKSDERELPPARTTVSCGVSTPTGASRSAMAESMWSAKPSR